MSKQQSLIIKGIAILMMLLVHLYRIHEDFTPWLYIGEKPLMQYLYNLADPVAIFILLSGYGLSYTAGRSYKSKFLKLLRLYTVYWVVLLIFPLCIGSVNRPEKYPGSMWEFISNILGYDCTYNQHCWFLLPYSILFLCSDKIKQFIDKVGYWCAIATTIILFFISSYIISRNNTGFFAFRGVHIVILCFQLLFPFVAGMIMESLNRQGKLLCKKIAPPPIALSLLMVVMVLRSPFHTHALTPFFSIVFVYLLYHMKIGGKVERILTELGKYSMPMWFIHGYFTVYLFHDYLCMLRYPLFMYMVLVLVSYGISVPIMYASGIFQKRVLKI